MFPGGFIKNVSLQRLGHFGTFWYQKSVPTSFENRYTIQMQKCLLSIGTPYMLYEFSEIFTKMIT
mgnify:FL=1